MTSRRSRAWARSCASHEDPPGMGVVFREISAYSKGLIERLLLQGTGAALERVED